MFIDTHAHLFTEEYDEDRENVVKECLAAGVEKIILPAIEADSHSRLEKMIAEHKNICFGTIGVHPTTINDNKDYIKELEIVKNKLDTNLEMYCAVGEIGLDLYWSKDFIKEQIIALKFQLDLALEHDLPVILHIRDAFKEVFDVLSGYKGLKGIFHGFSGTLDDYLTAKSLGDFVFGIGGVVTFKNSTLPSVVQQMNLEDIVLETDAPYLTPAPHRGKRNHPAHIPLIAQKIADLKGVTIDEVRDITTKNALRIFKI